MRHSRRHVASITAAVCLLATLVASAGPAAGAATSSIHWTACHANTGFPFECARVRVPLDYSNAAAGTISLAMVRLPASDPAHRIGSLFLNPGGPGGSGVDMALGAGPYLYGGAIQARFDIVGFDPRGIIRSTPLQCFDSSDQWGPYFTPFPFPMTRRQEQRWKTADLFLTGACSNRGGPIMDHMATADAARDLDRLRAAVGDDQLTYMGVSYGSFLGVTYANMFPDRVRALIVDGVLDPIAWTTGVDGESNTIPFSTRLRSDMGAQATLDEFFRLCDAGGSNCAFAPNSSDRYRAIANKLLQHAATIGGQKYAYSNLIGDTLISMYDSASWPSLAQFLADLEGQVGSQRLADSLSRLHQAQGLTHAAATPYRNYLEGFPGVACSDSQNPHSYQTWSDQGAISDERFGYFGRIWTWASSICATWPGIDRQRYLGPFDHATANPVMVIGNLFDPATRYQGAERVHQLLPNSALLTVHGWGHTSLFLSKCADRVSVAYLVHLTTPSPGTICQQDQVPFASSSKPTTASNLRTTLISALLPFVVRRAAMLP
jgi:pimeloyl-ACP methyl ester carboxylesterase